MQLSDREAGVAWWVACGSSNADIANFYGVSRQTVKNHIETICAKVGAPDRLNVALWWWRYAVGNETPVYNPDDRLTQRKKTSKAYSTARRVLNKDAWLDLCETYGNKCLGCGAEGNLTRDHIVPISLGGRHEESNIQPLCASCNSKKGNKIIDYRATPPSGE